MARLGLRRTGVVLFVALILGLGAIENWYGRTDSGDLFGTDAVQYLDCARAFDRGDLRSALNPLWNQGYPLLLAAARPLFRGDMTGEWLTMRTVNLLVLCFCLACFAGLLAELMHDHLGGSTTQDSRDAFWMCGACVFLASEVWLGHVSRVGPDELLSGFFFLACALLLRLLRQPTIFLGMIFGVVLGLGFLVKSVFLPLGCFLFGVLLVMTLRKRRQVAASVPGGVVFAAMVLAYGAVLSHEVGYRTLGESASLNYAWRVNRLAKWVHWQGGRDGAEKAWPRPWMARFTRWESNPPEFGQPIHPTRMVGVMPTVYVFDEPVKATYIPYYDPAYFYKGYKHLFRWRYQAIALGRGMLQLVQILLMQPMFYGVTATMWLWRRRKRDGIRGLWPIGVCATFGIALYVPVEVQDRYIQGFLAVLAAVALAPILTAETRRRRTAVALILAAAAMQMVKDQRVEFSRLVHGWSYKDNVEWKVADAVTRSGLQRGSQVGMIAWTPNLYCNWAYLSGVRITGEIASPVDENRFWALGEARRQVVLQEFKQNGDAAVLSWDRPPLGADAGWQRLDWTPMWMYRL